MDTAAGTDPNHYQFIVGPGASSSEILRKRVGGVWTNLISNLTSPHDAQTVYVSAVGTEISAKIDGSHITGSPVTDSGIVSGRAGVSGTTEATFRRAQWDNWEAADIGGTPSRMSLLGVGP